MTPASIIGIDPGAKGALVALDVATGDIVWCEDMPMLGKKVAARPLAHLFDREPDCVVVLEQVHGGGKNEHGGAASAFALGDSYGSVRTAVGVLGRPLVLYRPNQWKPAAGLNTDKGHSRAVAINTWPAWEPSFRLVKHDGRAEAALLAKFHLDRIRRAPLTVSDGVPW